MRLLCTRPVISHEVRLSLSSAANHVRNAPTLAHDPPLPCIPQLQTPETAKVPTARFPKRARNNVN